MRRLALAAALLLGCVSNQPVRKPIEVIGGYYDWGYYDWRTELHSELRELPEYCEWCEGTCISGACE